MGGNFPGGNFSGGVFLEPDKLSKLSNMRRSPSILLFHSSKVRKMCLQTRNFNTSGNGLEKFS